MRRASALLRAGRPPAIVVAVALATFGLAASRATAQVPQPGDPTTIDGPSADIDSLTGFSVARDGTGALVYLKRIDGVAHVFVSRLLGGVFATPEQVDAGLPGPSADPVVAAGNGGVVLVAFVNGGTLYAVDRPASDATASAPIPLAGGNAMNPAISMSNFGKAYLSFTATGSGGHDIRVAAYANGTWALEAPPLDANPADDAGVGTGRSQIATAGDGTAVVTWGEAGHVYVRRIRGTSPSIVFTQADLPAIGAASEVDADLPVVATGGDSSYAAIAYREHLAGGAQQEQSRVVMRRLHGSVLESPAYPDGLPSNGSGNATAPAVVAAEFGRGFVTTVRDDNQVWAMPLGGNLVPGRAARVDVQANATEPVAVPALAGLFSDFIAWQQDPSPLGAPEIHVRYADSSGVLGGDTVLSSPDLGPTDAAEGLVAGGDVAGDAAVAWIQGTGADTRIVAAQMYMPPGSPAPIPSPLYSRTRQPLLSWSPAKATWGPIRYTVAIDGTPLPPVAGLSRRPAQPLPDGPHTWQVTATNPAGAKKSSPTARVWVDAIPPAVQLTLFGRKRVAVTLHAVVSATDAPPPEPPSAASGIADVLIDWGDGTRAHIMHGMYHAYVRAGRYTVRVVVTDRAGNRTTVRQTIRIEPKPKPKPKKKPKARRGGKR